jgi:hypothetical protein
MRIVCFGQCINLKGLSCMHLLVRDRDFKWIFILTTIDILLSYKLHSPVKLIPDLHNSWFQSSLKTKLVYADMVFVEASKLGVILTSTMSTPLIFSCTIARFILIDDHTFLQ